MTTPRAEEHLEHLSDDQIDEMLMDSAEPEAHAHAAACALCAARLEEFRGSVAEFNLASMAWSEARSNTLTRDLRSHRPSQRISRTTVWSCVSATAVAAALLFAAGLQHRITGSHSEFSSVAVAGTDYASSRQQEIASDNAMLAAISSEIDRPTPVPSTLDDEDGISRSRRGALRQARD